MSPKTAPNQPLMLTFPFFKSQSCLGLLIITDVNPSVTEWIAHCYSDFYSNSMLQAYCIIRISTAGEGKLLMFLAFWSLVSLFLARLRYCRGVADTGNQCAAGAQRDYREGWPLITVETEANRDSKSTNVRCPSFLGWFIELFFFWPAMAALVDPVKIIFFPYRTFFQFICPHRPASWPGSRVGSPVS
jgi:hypothetical protein